MASNINDVLDHLATATGKGGPEHDTNKKGTDARKITIHVQQIVINLHPDTPTEYPPPETP